MMIYWTIWTIVLDYQKDRLSKIHPLIPWYIHRVIQSEPHRHLFLLRMQLRARG